MKRSQGLIIFFACLLLSCAISGGIFDKKEKSSQDYEKMREEMVKTQIEYMGITDKAVLRAMREVPRHLFVPGNVRARSYEDGPLPIGYGQTISQPYIVALMTQLLRVDRNSRVLEIGTGSGYQAAILAEIVKDVYSVEIVEPLYKRAGSTLKTTGYDSIYLKYADGYNGWKEHAPYDAIIVTAAAESVPPPLISQLKVGGRLCIPVGPPFMVQDLYLVSKKSRTDIVTEVIAQVTFVPLKRKEIK